MVISKRQRLFGKGYTGGSWDAGKNLFLYPGGSLISLCITIVFHALCFNCDVSSQHKAGCSQRWKRNAELCECKVSTVKSQLRPKQPWSFGFNLLVHRLRRQGGELESHRHHVSWSHIDLSSACHESHRSWRSTEGQRSPRFNCYVTFPTLNKYQYPVTVFPTVQGLSLV